MTMTLTHEQVLDSIILPAWRDSLPAGMRPQVDGFVRRNRPAIVKVVGVAWARKLWADDLSLAQKRLAAELAEELERGVQVAEVLDAAIDLKTPGALELATDLPDLSAEDRERRSATLVKALARGARESAKKKTTTQVDTAAAPEARTPAKRARKNLAAMELASAIEQSGERNDDDTRATLRGYSGWGGLSLKKYGGEFPEGWDPESPGLIHEYYTPAAVADAIAEAVCPMLEDLATPLGELNALEPSAGIGRFIDAFDRARCGAKPALTWSAVEFSDNSARLLGHIRPDVEVEHTTFETWVSRYGSALQGTFGLVVANPPYGERGSHAAEDPDRYYREKRASNYFLRRGLDLLAPQGIGVFLIPGGFLTGKNSQALRRKVLRRHHLAAAMRLPQQMFPGTSPRLKIDLLIFRSRGGELAEVDEADRFILDGGYYKSFPNHDLSETETFTGLPVFNERPQCVACVVNRFSWKRLASRPRSQVVSDESEFEKSLTPDLREALGVGGRVRRYLAAVSAGDPAALDLYGELLLDLEALAKQPKTVASIRTIAAKKDSINAEALVGVITTAGRVDIAEPGPESTRYEGRADDVVAQAELLYADRRRLTLDELIAFHEARGGMLTPSDIVDRLYAADWNIDGENLDHFVPLADYVTGDLWPRVELLQEPRSASVAARTTDVTEAIARAQLEKQLGRLQDVLSVAEFEDIQGVSPRQGWVPIDLVGQWLGDVAGDGRPLRVERRNGLVQAVGVSYVKLEYSLPAESAMAIGWLNHDFPYFQPKMDPPRSNLPLPPGSNAMETPLWTPDASDPDKKISIDELRRRWGIYYEAHFYAWVLRDPPRKAAIERRYNAAFRGFVPREYSGEPLDIARWGPDITLAPHQAAGARRVLSRRGGLIAFDVGVGKTYTAVAVVARARQEGWARRPVVLVPQSLVWKWKRDFTRCLPDFRVVVIGSEMHRLQSGKRVKAANKLLKEQQITADEHEQMLMTSRTDSSKDRGDKWVAFQSGLFDVAIVSYEAFPRTRVREESLERYAERSESIMRSVELTIRTAEGKDPNKLTERQKAIKERGVRAWIEDKISSKHEPDPRITWEDIGVDLLVVDEAASFKNLHMPETREGGVPRYMGGGGRDGSKRAWNFDFRAGLVREATGGAGVVLLSATPAKNSPLEFYNMIQFIDGGAWADRGITDPEQFIDRYTRIATQNVVTPSFQIEQRPAVVGFTQLDELRSIVFRYSEWRKAKDVGIELPRPRVCRCEVDLDETQQAKYQEFVALIEKTLESGGNSGSILGYLARLGLVALHAQLDEGYTWKTALGGKTTRQVSGGALGHWVQQGWHVVPPDPAKKKKKAEDDKITITRDLPTPDPSSPKFRAIAQRVVAQPSCGHIIFCEPTAAHAWILAVLVEHGVPRKRIAVLNAEVTKAAARVKIARDFNGEEGEPKYDVVIANSVAYEGIDLQVRTCAIHHADLPWTPADLEQRNGRAHRQGNQFATISIYYYLGKGSMDLFRYDLIQGKAGWLEDLIAGNPETSNPAAQAELTPEDYLVALSADPEKTRRLIEEKRAGDADKKRKAIIGTANRLLQRASVLFANAYRETSERAARSRAEGEELLERLSKYSAVWPYGGLVAEARRQPIVLTSSAGVPIWEGLKLRRSATDFAAEFFEVGKQSASDATTISIREAGSAEWKRVHLADLNAAIDPSSLGFGSDRSLMDHAMADVFAMGGMQPMGGRSPAKNWIWPEDDAVKMEKEARSLARTTGMEALLVLHFVGASDAFRTAVWPAIRDAMMKSPSGLLPVEREGALQLVESLAEGDELLPWTPWGYDRFLKLALASDLKVGDLVTVSRRWWDRAFPRALLKRTESETEAQAKESAPETPTPSPSEVTAAVRAAESAQLTELAQTPEGYSLLLAQLGKLAEIEDPLLIAPRFGDQWITDFTSKYTTQEAEGRQDTEPSEVWQTEEYLDQILERIREHILEEGAVVREDPRRAEALQVVPDGIRGTAEEGFYVLREDGADSSAADNRAGSSRRYIKLLDELSLDADVLVGVENIDHPGNQGPPLAAGDSIYTVGPDLDTETIEHNWATYKELAQSVRGAPTALEQARKAMVFARVLVQAPKCQGEAKRSALEFLRGAFVYYRNAQERVNQGAAGAAYANLRRVSRYLAREAYNLAESCAAGQLALVTPSPIDVGNVSDAALDASEEAGDPDYEAIEVSDDDEADDTNADDEDHYDADEES